MCDFTTFISSFVEAIKPNYKGFEPHTSPLFLTAETVHDLAVVGLNKSEQKQTERNDKRKNKKQKSTQIVQYTVNLAEVAIELQEANTEVPWIRIIRCGSSQDNPKESEGKQSTGTYYRPRSKLARFAHCQVILMHP